MEEEEGKEGGKLARKCGKGGVQRLKLDFLLLFFYCDAIRRQPCILPEHGLASLASPINRTGDPDRRADPQDAWIRDEIDDPAVPVR